MTVRCKFTLAEIRNHHWGKGRTFVFTALYDTSIPEDQRFAQGDAEWSLRDVRIVSNRTNSDKPITLIAPKPRRIDAGGTRVVF